MSKKKALHNIKQLEEEDDFDTMVSTLMDKGLLENMKLLLQEVIGENISYQHCKTFLSSFMTFKFPDEVFGKKGELEDIVMSVGQELISNFKDYLLEKSDFSKDLYYKYVNIFENWKKNDKQNLLFVFASAYQDLQITKQHTNDKEWIDQMNHQLKLIEKAIYKLGGDKMVEEFLNGEYFIKLLGQDVKNKIINELQKGYFRLIKEELNHLDKKPYYVIKSFKEIRDKVSLPTIKIELLEQKLQKKERMKLIVTFLKKIVEVLPIDKEMKKKLQWINNTLIHISKHNIKDIEIENIIFIIKYIYEKIGLIK